MALEEYLWLGVRIPVVFLREYIQYGTGRYGGSIPQPLRYTPLAQLVRASDS